MGGKNSGGGGGMSAMPTPQPSPYEQQLANISGDIYNTTDPLRRTYIQDWMNFLTPQKVLKQGATPIRTPIYENVPTSTSGQMYIDPATGQIYGNSGAIHIGREGDASIFNNTQLDSGYSVGWTPLQPYGNPSTTGGGQAITGYKEEYRPEDYITQAFNPANLPGYTPMYDISRRGLESQYATAKDQITANTPRGGALSDALAKLELGRAESVGGLPGQISSNLITDMLNKSYGAAFNAPSQAISGLSAANQGYTSTQNAMMNAYMQQQALENQQSNSKSSGLGLLGTGLGMTVGSMLGSPNTPWIFK